MSLRGRGLAVDEQILSGASHSSGRSLSASCASAAARPRRQLQGEAAVRAALLLNPCVGGPLLLLLQLLHARPYVFEDIRRGRSERLKGDVRSAESALGHEHFRRSAGCLQGHADDLRGAPAMGCGCSSWNPETLYPTLTCRCVCTGVSPRRD
jgi:hypothetical protein